MMLLSIIPKLPSGSKEKRDWARNRQIKNAPRGREENKGERRRGQSSLHDSKERVFCWAHFVELKFTQFTHLYTNSPVRKR